MFINPSIWVHSLSSDETRLRTVIDRYADLHRRLLEIRAGRDRVRTILLGVMNLRGARRLDGDASRLVVSATPRFTWDEAALRSTLDPAGLWERVRVCDPDSVVRLLRKGSPGFALRDVILRSRVRSGESRCLAVVWKDSACRLNP